MAIGFDKHPQGAFNPSPADYGLGDWYGKTGMMLTTQFFGMKIQRYMHEHGISRETLAKVAAKAFRNGAKNENAWRRTPLSEDQILDAPMLADPLTQFMFCSPGEGGVALVLAAAERARALTDRPVYLRSAVLRSRPFGSFEVFNPGLAAERGASPSRRRRRRRVRDGRHRARRDRRRPGPGHRVRRRDHAPRRVRLLRRRRAGGPRSSRAAPRSTGRLPVNTDGGCLANGEPIGASGLRQVYESVLQLRGDAGERQVPGDPRTAFTHVYGAPGISACTVLSR